MGNNGNEVWTFAGWTGSNLSGQTKNVKIAKGQTGDKSYLANWKETHPSSDYVQLKITINDSNSAGKAANAGYVQVTYHTKAGSGTGIMPTVLIKDSMLLISSWIRQQHRKSTILTMMRQTRIPSKIRTLSLMR
ncbi:MAG: hypothetical protein IJ815_00290 [Lachnospiraceae bacterium]|nr:hypothetical protein [Lachnospiraceae bacterium]